MSPEWQLHFYCSYCRKKCHAWKGDFNFNEAFIWLHKGYLLQIANWFYSNLYSLSYKANTASEKHVPIWGLPTLFYSVFFFFFFVDSSCKCLKMVICFNQPTVRIDHWWEINQQILSSERLTAVHFGDFWFLKMT